MDVRTLHSLLGNLIDEGHGDLEVTSEGCDCDGQVNQVTVESGWVFDGAASKTYFAYLRRETATEQAEREERYRDKHAKD